MLNENGTKENAGQTISKTATSFMISSKAKLDLPGFTEERHWHSDGLYGYQLDNYRRNMDKVEQALSIIQNLDIDFHVVDSGIYKYAVKKGIVK